jgi:hypothetical protein
MRMCTTMRTTTQTMARLVGGGPLRSREMPRGTKATQRPSTAMKDCGIWVGRMALLSSARERLFVRHLL